MTLLTWLHNQFYKDDLFRGVAGGDISTFNLRHLHEGCDSATECHRELDMSVLDTGNRLFRVWCLVTMTFVAIGPLADVFDPAARRTIPSISSVRSGLHFMMASTSIY